MPIIVLASRLCPEGMEGTIYAVKMLMYIYSLYIFSSYVLYCIVLYCIVLCYIIYNNIYKDSNNMGTIHAAKIC
jgi:hypothetical protein